MRAWRVEYLKEHVGPSWVVLREDGQAYAYCTSQAMAANVCSALNLHEQWVMQESGVQHSLDLEKLENSIHKRLDELGLGEDLDAWVEELQARYTTLKNDRNNLRALLQECGGELGFNDLNDLAFESELAGRVRAALKGEVRP